MNEQETEQSWQIYNEEEAAKKVEREKKIQRNARKLELKKEKVIGKLIRHEDQVRGSKAQAEQALQLKRDLHLRMQEERKLAQATLKQIELLETQTVDKALSKVGTDGA